MRGRGRTPVSSVSLKIALIEGPVRAPGAVAAPALSREGLSGPGWPAGSCGEGRRWQGSGVVFATGRERPKALPVPWGVRSGDSCNRAWVPWVPQAALCLRAQPHVVH